MLPAVSDLLSSIANETKVGDLCYSKKVCVWVCGKWHVCM